MEDLQSLMVLLGGETEQAMATRTRRTHSAVFEVNVALASIDGDRTLAQRVEVPLDQMTKWKRQLSERAEPKGQ